MPATNRGAHRQNQSIAADNIPWYLSINTTTASLLEAATEGASRHTHRPRGERRGVSVAVRAVRTEEVVRESISAMKGEADQRSVLQFYCTYLAPAFRG